MTTTTYSTGDKVTVRHHDGIYSYDVPCTVVAVAGSSITVDDGLGTYQVPAGDVTLVERAEVQVVEVEAVEVTPIHDAPQYGKLAVSDPQLAVIAYAIEATDGIITRGAGVGRATVATLNAMRRRGYVTLTTRTEGRRVIVTGAIVTAWGARRVKELTAPAKRIVVNSLAA